MLHVCVCVILWSQQQHEVCVIFQIDWPMKLFLAHGVVCGMEYLHSILPHPVIHGDLKIQNVLVGDGLVAKVCLILCTDNLCVCVHCYITKVAQFRHIVAAGGFLPPGVTN